MLTLLPAAPPRHRSAPAKAILALRQRIRRHLGRPVRPPIHASWSDELTFDTRDRLIAVIRILYERCPDRHVLIDLTCCPYLSEEGLGALVLLWREAKECGVRLKVHAVAQPLAKLQQTLQGSPMAAYLV